MKSGVQLMSFDSDVKKRIIQTLPFIKELLPEEDLAKDELLELALCNYLPLANHGTANLDRAIYCWAVSQNAPQCSLQLLNEQFDTMIEAYDDSERVFHRGLGHPRSLFPDLAQVIYKSLLDKPRSLEEAIAEITKLAAQLLPHPVELARESQGVIAAYYHDVVHRAGIKPASLERYHKNDSFEINSHDVPLTHALLQKDKAETPEELSCIVAEDALRKMKAKDEAILTIISAINATKPFEQCSEPEYIEASLIRVATEHRIRIYSASAVQLAIDLANRDLAAYGEDSLDEFNTKSWAMMLEREPSLQESTHVLQDEALAISGFYDSHRKLLERILNQGLKIYHGKIDNVRIQKLNEKASETIVRDIILQGIQLASLMLLMVAKTTRSDEAIEKLLCQYEASTKIHPSTIPAEVFEVLQQHDKLCLVNGQQVHRGTSNAKFALRFVNLIGMENLLIIASRYPDLSSLNFEVNLKALTKKAIPIEALQAHGSFPPPVKQKVLNQEREEEKFALN